VARVARALTAIEVQRLDTTGLHAVGTVPGLCLRALPPPSTAETWALRLLVSGKRRALGLGGDPALSLAQAVASARERRMAELGVRDPLVAERDAPEAAHSASVGPVTFAQAAEAYISTHAAGWKHPLQASQGVARSNYTYPKIGGLDIMAIGIAEVLSVLEPIWHAKTETASKMRGQIELILAWVLQAQRDRSTQSGSVARASRHAASSARKESDTPQSHGAVRRPDAGLHESPGQGRWKRRTRPGVHDPDGDAVG